MSTENGSPPVGEIARMYGVMRPELRASSVPPPIKETKNYSGDPLKRAWQAEIGRAVLDGVIGDELKKRVNNAKKAIEEKELPDNYEKSKHKKPKNKKEREEADKRFAEQKNNEALGRWVLGWKPEDGSEQDFHEQLNEQKAATKMFNFVGELRSDAIPAVSGGAVGDAVTVGIARHPVDPFLQDVYDEIEARTPLTSENVNEIIASVRAEATARGLAGNAHYRDIKARLIQLANNTRGREAATAGRYRIVTSQEAVDTFRALPNNYRDREQWVREQLAEIAAAAKPSGGFGGANFEPYQMLTLADAEIKKYHRGLWGEIHHTFGLMDLGAASKTNGDLKAMVEPSASISAETFQQLLRIKIHRVLDPLGVEIFGVAEALRLYEKHRLELFKKHTDNLGGFMNAIAWELEGYTWAQAKVFASDLGRPFPPNMWAAQDAENFFFGTLRNIVPVRDPTQGNIELRCSGQYTAFRLATLWDQNASVNGFFKNEGKKYMDPYLIDFWQYIGESALKDDGTPKRSASGAINRLTQNYIDCGLLIRLASGKYMVPLTLENVKFENLVFSDDDMGVVKGIGPKYYAYVITTDSIRAATDPGGYYNDPTGEKLIQLVDKLSLWKNLIPLTRKEEAYCMLIESLIDFQLKRNLGNFKSYAQRYNPKTNDEPIGDKKALVRYIGALINAPFDVRWDGPVFARFIEKYRNWGITINDFMPKYNILGQRMAG